MGQSASQEAGILWTEHEALRDRHNEWKQEADAATKHVGFERGKRDAAVKKAAADLKKEVERQEARHKATYGKLLSELQASKAQLELVNKDIAKLPPVASARSSRMSMARPSMRPRATLARKSVLPTVEELRARMEAEQAKKLAEPESSSSSSA